MHCVVLFLLYIHALDQIHRMYGLYVIGAAIYFRHSAPLTRRKLHVNALEIITISQDDNNKVESFYGSI